MHGHSFSQLKPTHDLFAKYFVEATISSAKHVMLDMHIIIIIPLAIIIGIKEAAGTLRLHCIAAKHQSVLSKATDVSFATAYSQGPYLPINNFTPAFILKGSHAAIMGAALLAVGGV